MKKITACAAVIVFVIFYTHLVGAITTTGSGDLFGDSYSYEFTIVEGSSFDLFDATLTSTSTDSLSGALIDLIAFDMDATLGTDFSIVDISPSWVFSAGSGGVEFDYIGERVAPGDRLSPGESLLFTFDFVDGFSFPTDPFSLWTGTDGSRGTGIGGGDDFGQVAVSFQQLGSGGKDSDLVASDWDGTSVPEPATLVLLGSGLALMGLLGRRKSRKSTS